MMVGHEEAVNAQLQTAYLCVAIQTKAWVGGEGSKMFRRPEAKGRVAVEDRTRLLEEPATGQ
jgi:hypothetical protein